MAGIFADLYAGKIDGLEYSDYLSNVENVPERYFKGRYDYNSSGEVLIKGSCYNYFDKLNNGLSFYYEVDTSYPGKICFVDSGTSTSLYVYNADKNALVSSHITANRFVKNTIIVLTMMVRILFQVFRQIHLLHHIKLYFILISLFSLLRRRL